MRAALVLRLALFLAFALAAASASAEKMDVKLGLWESTLTTAVSGAPPIDVSRLSQLSAEQRARLEAVFQKRAAQGPQTLTHTYQTCLTKKKLAEDPFSEPAPKGEKCATKIVSQTRTVWQGSRVCTGDEGRQEYSGKITAVSREQVRGTILVKMSDGGNSMTNHAKYSSKWLGSDCGSLK
jgi:Protein of unknown function (DUF3617)